MIAIGGTGRGADTVIVLKTAFSCDLFARDMEEEKKGDQEDPTRLVGLLCHLQLPGLHPALLRRCLGHRGGAFHESAP